MPHSMLSFFIMKEDPYEILKCSKHDSFDTIKMSHRKLILTYHPDKKGEKSADQFVKIQTAFDAIKKQKEKDALFKSQLTIFYDHFLPILYVFCNHVLNKPRPITINISVTLEEIRSGVVKKITYKRFVRGKMTRETIFVDLGEIRDEYVFEGFGDDNPFFDSFGDVIVKLSPKLPDGFQHISIPEESVVSLDKAIGLHEYLYGVDISVLGGAKHVPFSHGDEVTIRSKSWSGASHNTTIHVRFTLSFNTLREETLRDSRFKDMIQTYFHVVAP